MRFLRRREIGQFIQEEIKGHAHKHGTPTMGGVVFVIAAILGWLLAHVRVWSPDTGLSFEMRPFNSGGWLAVLALGGMALVGFFDDWIKYKHKRSLGLSKTAKF